jgi:hypothetical protein
MYAGCPNPIEAAHSAKYNDVPPHVSFVAFLVIVVFGIPVSVGDTAFTGAPVPVVAVSLEVKFPEPSHSAIREAVPPEMVTEDRSTEVNSDDGSTHVQAPSVPQPKRPGS